LLVDIIVMRILRHRRIRPYVDRAYPAVSQYTTRFGRRVYPRMVGTGTPHGDGGCPAAQGVSCSSRRRRWDWLGWWRWSTGPC